MRWGSLEDGWAGRMIRKDRYIRCGLLQKMMIWRQRGAEIRMGRRLDIREIFDPALRRNEKKKFNVIDTWTVLHDS